jgi:hypothetical protein
MRHKNHIEKNSKSQIPNSKQIRKSKSKIPKNYIWVIKYLVIGCCLIFGAWNLGFIKASVLCGERK